MPENFVPKRERLSKTPAKVTRRNFRIMPTMQEKNCIQNFIKEYGQSHFNDVLQTAAKMLSEGGGVVIECLSENNFVIYRDNGERFYFDKSSLSLYLILCLRAIKNIITISEQNKDQYLELYEKHEENLKLILENDEYLDWRRNKLQKI